MALGTKPRWDKYDGYVGNYRGFLADDIDLETESNVVLAVGHDVNGAVVVGSGQTGIKGLMIIPVGIDIYGHLLDGGINNMAGDPCDVGKHGEITNFRPTAIGNSFAVVGPGSGNFTVLVNGKPTANVAFGATATEFRDAIVAVDDGFATADFTVTGTAPNFTVVAPNNVTITAGTNSTVTSASASPEAGKNYYAHADGSVNAVKGADGIYVGHTAEADRLIVNVLDATP